MVFLSGPNVAGEVLCAYGKITPADLYKLKCRDQLQAFHRKLMSRPVTVKHVKHMDKWLKKHGCGPMQKLTQADAEYIQQGNTPEPGWLTAIIPVEQARVIDAIPS